MPHPQTNPLIGLPFYELLQVSGSDPIIYEVRLTEPPECPHCQSSRERLELRDYVPRQLRHLSIGLKACRLQIRVPRFRCLRCRKYFRQSLPGVLPYQHATEAFREEVAKKHEAGIPQSTLSRMLEVGSATIERYYHHLNERKVAETSNDPAPEILGLDEHFFTKKQGYATSFADLAKGKIHDVVLGRSVEDLKEFLKNMKGKHQTRLVIIDLSKTFRAIAKQFFRNADIVADRFHVIQLINRQFKKTWGLIDPESRKNRNLSSLMGYHEWNLEEDQHEKLMSYLESSPVIQALYVFKQKLCRLMTKKHQTARQARKLIPKFLEMIRELKESGFARMRTLGETMEEWREEIVRMWRYHQTNSTLEGLHTKMEMISRRAFGFRNFENYRLRVKAQCG
jgi:transposase